jgi:hypothetical protein
MISQIPPNTHQQIAPISKALSSLSPLSSIVARVDDSIKNGLEASRDLWFVLLVVSTVLVFVGVVLEEAEGWMPYLERLLPLTEIMQYRLIKRVAKLGWILIVAGVMGEGAFEVLVSRADNQLHQFDEAVLNEARREAGDAATSAEIAREEADAARAEAETAKTAAGIALGKSDRANAAAGKALITSKSATDAASEAQEKVEAVAEQADNIDRDL